MTTTVEKPSDKPSCPNFGSGPCRKHPGYNLDIAKLDVLGRSHRSALGKGKIEKAINLSKELLELPSDYLLGIVAGSDTGAVEMAMWSLLGARPVTICSWEAFGHGWLVDAVQQLKIDVVDLSAPYGELPDLSKVDPKHDVVFTWNGTTSGVRVPNADWIRDDREGLTICDATSSIFAMDMDWKKLDVITYSWQKVLGGEAAHGVLILSPRAVERLESYTPTWPIPKIFRLTSNKKLIKDIFTGAVTNTISMLCVEDYIDALEWAISLGGQKELIRKSLESFHVIEEFVEKNSSWISFLAKNPAIRSNTSVCLQLHSLKPEQVKRLTKLLEVEKVAYDIDSYRDAPPGIRIWCGTTVQTEDITILMRWLEWAHNVIMND